MTETRDENPSKDFFVSYTSADETWAVWIAWQLEDAGYRITIQAWDFLSGRDWVHEMQQALATAHRVVAVLSPAYLDSDHGEAEWRAVYADDPSGEKARLWPVRVAEVDPPGLLKTRVYTDLVGLSEQTARDRLLNDARSERGKPATPPDYPGGLGSARSTRTAPRFPGALPPTWNVPLRNPHFAGRDGLLAEVRSLLNASDARVRRVALTGLGGVGKTHVAIEYAYRHHHEFDVVWWIRATKLSTLLDGLAALALKAPLSHDLKLPADTPQPEVIPAVRAWLEQHPRWLLIIDDAASPPELADLLPRATIGHVLITSQQATGWERIASHCEVDPLDPDDAAAFLLNWTRHDDQPAAQELATTLGSLPLALEQAAAYVTATGISLHAYEELFTTRAMELLSRGQPLDYERTVATTWSLALERLTEPAVALLDLLAFCAPDDFPQPVLVNHDEILPDLLRTVVTDPLEFGDLLTELRRYSLVRITGDGLGMHSLLQLVVRSELTVEQHDRWARASLALLLDAFPAPPEATAWPQCQRLLSHALVILAHADHVRLEPSEGRAVLLNHVGLYIRERGQLHQAKPIFEYAVALFIQALGDDHPETVGSMLNFAFTLHELGELRAARELGERTVSTYRRVLGDEHPKTLLAMNNLALTLGSLGELRAARELGERTVSTYRRVLGDEHPDTLRSMHNHAGLLHDLGELRAARALQEKVLDARQRVLGVDHLSVVSSMDSLASILGDLEELDAARALLEQVLAIRRRVLGDDHPRTLESIEGLAVFFERSGELDEARVRHELALVGFRRVLGDEHPTTLFVMSNLAATLHNLGEREPARAMHEQILAARRRVLGDEHPNTLDSMHNLADSLLQLGRPRDALELNEQALAGFRRVLGEEHPDTLDSMNNLGANLHKLGRLAQAHALFEQAATGFRRVLGENHPKTQRAMNNLAAIRRAFPLWLP